MGNIALYLESFLWYHHLGVLAALDGGYFQEAGLTVTLHVPEYHTQGIDKVVRGDIDFALSEPIHTLPFQVQGQPVISVGQLFELQQSSIMGLADRVTVATDFQGKRLGYPTAPGPNGPEILRQVAAAQGILLVPDSVQLVSIGDDLIGALARNQADLVLVTAQHSVLLAEQQGLDVILFSTETAGIPSFGHNVLVTRESVIQAHPDRTRRLVEAIAKGTQQVQADIAYARELAKRFIQFPANLGEAFLQRTLPVLTPHLRQPSDLWDRVLGWMQSSKLLPIGTVPDNRLFTNEFALNDPQGRPRIYGPPLGAPR